MPSSFGLAFLGISAFLYAMRYLCAAVICSGGGITGQSGFDSVYKNVGSELTILSIVCLFVGLGVAFKDVFPTVVAVWKDEPIEGSNKKDAPLL